MEILVFIGTSSVTTKLDGIALDIVGKKCYLIEFKRTRDRRHSYEERAMKVARQQYKSLLSGLQAVGQQKGWKVEQLVFVGGTCGSVNVETFNQNLKLLEVPSAFVLLLGASLVLPLLHFNCQMPFFSLRSASLGFPRSQ